MDEATTLLFENYLEGQLSPKDKAAFEARLDQDPEFASEFETYKELSEHLAHQFSEERTDVRNTLTQVSDDFFAETSSEKKDTKIIKFKPWQYSIAASIALLIGFFIFQNSGAPNVDDYIFSESISLTERSSEITINKAETSFNTGAYTETIEQFSILLKEDPSNTEYQFYKALAHDALNEYDMVDNLFGILAQGNSAYKYKATFYAAISQWKRNQIDPAKDLLDMIPKNAPEYNQAQKLLKKL